MKYKLPKNYVVLVYDEKVLGHFLRIAIVTGVLPSNDCEIKGAKVRIKKSNAILKRPVNKLFPIEYTYDTNQTDKAREQMLRWEAAANGELKRKYVNCVNIGREEESLDITNINLLLRFNKTRETCKNRLGAWWMKSVLKLSWRKSLLCRIQSMDLQSKSMDWFLYDRNLRHERVNALLLACICGDIFLDYEKIIDIYASKYHRRMLLINLLQFRKTHRFPLIWNVLLQLLGLQLCLLFFS